jgi:hypothetical protein
MDQRSL